MTMETPKGYIAIYEGDTPPDGWKFCPEHETGIFPSNERGVYPLVTWEKVKELNPTIKLIIKE